MDLGLKGRRVLVTGGSRGIGRECALSLAREGANVCINYVRNELAAERTRQDLLAPGVSADKLQADVTDVDAARSLVEQAIATMGGLEVLIHSAGINISAAEGIDELEAWHRTID
jgi:3-oxoacyl-[acyl-carrier protein] reductase